MSWVYQGDNYRYSDEEILANRKRWTDGLRSGTYVQGQGRLLITAPQDGGSDRYCCLGVACEALEIPRILNGYDVTRSGQYPGVSTMSLPPSLRKALGIGDQDQATLIKMNDGICGGQRSDFKEIADYIDKLPIYTGMEP